MYWMSRTAIWNSRDSVLDSLKEDCNRFRNRNNDCLKISPIHSEVAGLRYNSHMAQPVIRRSQFVKYLLNLPVSSHSSSIWPLNLQICPYLSKFDSGVVVRWWLELPAWLVSRVQHTSLQFIIWFWVVKADRYKCWDLSKFDCSKIVPRWHRLLVWLVWLIWLHSPRLVILSWLVIVRAKSFVIAKARIIHAVLISTQLWDRWCYRRQC